MIWLLFFTVLLWALAPGMARACTTVLVGKDASATGKVLVGHNEDSGGRYVMHRHLVPSLSGRKGATARFEPGTALLPLPEDRAELYWSEARTSSADGASFCDFYVNGNGVVVCSDNCSPSREDQPELCQGGMGYGLRRLTAEGARSAAHAIEIAIRLLDHFGYIASGRSYHFSDANESWVLQVVQGRGHYAVKRVPDDEVYLNPNHYTIRTPDPETPGLKELEAYATLRGWYRPEDGPFDFARAFQAPTSWRNEKNFHRHLRGLEILLERPFPEEVELPFSIVPARKVGPDTVKKILRSHFEGTPSDVSKGASPHFMPTRPICVGTTLESHVVEPSHDPAKTVIHRALGRPCLAPYVPFLFGGLSPTEAPEKALTSHFSVPASDMDYSDTPWFRHTALQAAADLLYGGQTTELRTILHSLESRMEEELKMLLHAPFSKELAAEQARRFEQQASETVLELYEGLRVLEGEGQGLVVGSTDRPFTLTFDAHDLRLRDLDIGQTLCGPHFVGTSLWSHAIRVEPDGERLCLTFEGGEWRTSAVSCLTDLWVLLALHGGRRAGRVLVHTVREDPDTREGRENSCGGA